MNILDNCNNTFVKVKLTSLLNIVSFTHKRASNSTCL